VTKCRKGFTTIELIMAISILMLLAGLVVVGFNVVGNSGKKNATKIALESYRAMLGELDAAAMLQRVKDLYGPDYGKKAMQAPGSVALAPGSVATDADRIAAVFAPGLGPKGLGNTANVLTQLYAMPRNRQILQALPAEKIVKVFNPHPNPPGSVNVVIVLVDGWGNPLIFVPPGGLMEVRFKDGSVRKVTSVGVVNNNTDPPPPGATAFFASAGPDGIFGWVNVDREDEFKPGEDIVGGDDNVYSFEN